MASHMFFTTFGLKRFIKNRADTFIKFSRKNVVVVLFVVNIDTYEKICSEYYYVNTIAG